MATAPDQPRAIDAARAMRRRAREREARERVRRADNGLLFAVLGQVPMMVLAALATSAASGRGRADEALCTLVFLGFFVAQCVCVYLLSRALEEPRPWFRLGSMLLPFAGLSVLIAIHSRAMRRLRRP